MNDGNRKNLDFLYRIKTKEELAKATKSLLGVDDNGLSPKGRLTLFLLVELPEYSWISPMKWRLHLSLHKFLNA